jgi:hypothetical protein
MNRKYDRHIPPALPAHRMLTHTIADIPSFIDLRSSCGPVKNQGAEGACTAHAGASAAEWIFRRYFHKFPIFSPQYTYAKELLAQGDFPNDVGSDGLTLCGTMIKDGCCELALYPYQPGNILRPTPAQDDNARQFQMGAYHGVGNSKVTLSVLGDVIPWPIEMGFSVYSSFESDYTAETGIMTVPKPGESLLGGHEVLLSGGYDICDAPVLRPAGCPPAVLVQNSWGTGWGLSGFFWCPLEILDLPTTDLKITHSGKPW